MSWNSRFKEKRNELFNLKNKECQEKFREATQEANNNNYLSCVFDDEADLNVLTNKFLKRLQKTINKCFRKVRITERTDKEKDDLFAKWKFLKKQSDKESTEELVEIEKEIANKYAEEYFDKIKKRTEGTDCEDVGISSGKLWNLKKELFPKCRDPPTAMKDPQSGNLLTTDEKIHKAALNVYTKRLDNRPMKDDL